MSNPKSSSSDEPKTERVSKLIARAGLASRRAAEDIIAAGRVAVNGHFITEQGVKADPQNDKITVDGTALKLEDKPTTVVVLHKPKYTITTRDDPENRAKVFDLLPHSYANLHAVGRLDFETSGVLILTDDGTLTHLLTHPSHGVEKIYEARVRGEVSKQTLELLERGVKLEDGVTSPCRARVLAQRDKNALVEITLREGRTRQVRRMLETVSHAASSLRRVYFAGIELEGMQPGEHRELLPVEIKKLRRVAEAGLKSQSRPRSRPKPHPRPTDEEPEEAQPAAQPHARMSRSNNGRANSARAGESRSGESRSGESRSGEERGGIRENRGSENRVNGSRGGGSRGDDENRDRESRDGQNRGRDGRGRGDDSRGGSRSGEGRGSERESRGGENRGIRNRESGEGRANPARSDGRANGIRGGESRGGTSGARQHRGSENRDANRGGEGRMGQSRGGENRGGENRAGQNRGGESRGARESRGDGDRGAGENRGASREGEKSSVARRIERRWKKQQ